MDRLYNKLLAWLTLGVFCLIPAFAAAADSSGSLLVYAGAASKPPAEEAARAFEQQTGIKVDLLFGGSGYVLSQMKLARRGDLYFPGSSDYMEKAKREGLVLPDTERIIVYLAPAINVQAGNPQQIRQLADLTRPGLRVAIANPEGVCVGAYAVEIIEKNFTAEQKRAFRDNLVNYTGSCSKTASAVSLKAVDAVIGWRVFQYWDPQRIESIPLEAGQVSRIGYIPIAVTRFSSQPALARQFIEFLQSPAGQQIFSRYRYFATASDAMQWVGEDKQVGGEYAVPDDWLVPAP
jgi:molybdate transport system substrate-binding protein